jgi:hypothetical protein
VNTGAPFPSVDVAQGRVLHFQRKLHEWASNDAERGFRDLWNLVCDPATLVVAWSRVKTNHSVCSWRAGCGGSRTSGSEGGGEETTGRKADTGASPPTLRAAEQYRARTHARISSRRLACVTHDARAPLGMQR